MITVPEQIEREITIAAALDKVWAAITEAQHVAGWFGDAGAEIDLRPGGAMRMSWRIEGKVDTCHAVVEKVDPPHLFSYRWARPLGDLPNAGNSTLVEFTLTAEGGGTRLRVVESGFRELDMPEQDQADYAAGNIEGWHSELDELREYATSGF